MRDLSGYDPLMSATECPFSVGQTVYYRPGPRAYGWTVPESMPPPGTAVKITGIVNQAYILIEGYEDHPGGGMHWQCFSPD